MVEQVCGSDIKQGNVIHLLGKKNQHADCPFRQPVMPASLDVDANTEV